jgi:rubredoxin
MTATVIHIDVYRAVWRTCTLACKACGYVWEGLVRDGINLRDITCPKCKLHAAKLLAAGELEKLPRHMRKDCRLA